MREGAQRQEEREFAEESDSLWLITLGPLVWAVHFVIAYASAAVWCAKIVGTNDSLLPWRVGIAGLTVIALGLIGWLGWRAWKQWDVLTDHDYTHPGPSTEDRHEFLGHAAFLLCGAAFIGVIYAALPAIFIATCR